MYACYVRNPSTNSVASCLGFNGSAAVIVENCDVELSGATGGFTAIYAGDAARVVNNRIIDSQGSGITLYASNAVVVDNVFFEAVVGPCIVVLGGVGNTVFVRGNTGRGKAIGVQCANTAYNYTSYFGDNHFTDMSTAAFVSLYDGTAQIAGWFSHNRFRDNAADVDGWDGWYAAGAQNVASGTTGTPATDYTDYANNLLTLVSDAPGKGAASVKNRDIGALQTTSGGGGRILEPAMNLGSFCINEYLTIPANTRSATTGAATEPSALTYAIYEEGNTTQLVGPTNFTDTLNAPFDSVVGSYQVRVQLLAATGFEMGKTYVVVVVATVGGITDTVTHIFQMNNYMVPVFIAPTTVTDNKDDTSTLTFKSLDGKSSLMTTTFDNTSTGTGVRSAGTIG
jgi:hypothetical protein